MLETLKQPNQLICLVAEKAGQTARISVWHIRAAEEAEIARIAVHERMQRQGAARQTDARTLENVYVKNSKN